MSGVWGGRVGQVDNGYKDWWRTVVSRRKDKDTGGICVKVVERGLRTGWHRACVGEKIKLWSVGLVLKRHWKPGCYWLCVGKRVQTQSWEYGEVIEGHNFGRWRRHHRREVFTGEVAMRTSTVKEMDEDLWGNVSPMEEDLFIVLPATAGIRSVTSLCMSRGFLALACSSSRSTDNRFNLLSLCSNPNMGLITWRFGHLMEGTKACARPAVDDSAEGFYMIHDHSNASLSGNRFSGIHYTVWTSLWDTSYLL